MDELATARIELARLEAKAENLLQQFLDTKEAGTAQRAKIDALLRNRPTPINRLPAELLLDILSLAIPRRMDVSLSVYKYDGRRKLELASVSRRWRDIIFGCPSLWTTIEVDPSTPSPAVYLKRSHDAPLDVIIQCQPRYGFAGHKEVDLLLAKLASLIPSVQRWRSMVITGDLDLLQIHNPIVRKFSRLTFPSLKSVIIRPREPLDANHGNALLTYPDFLAPKYTPVLENMELVSYPQSARFRTVNTLKSLKLTLFPNIDPTIIRQIPAESLTSLSLRGDVSFLGLIPNSIHFPLLHTLNLQLVGGRQFLEAIVVPVLTQFAYVCDPREDRTAVVFGDPGSKFDCVHRLKFSPGASLPHDSIDYGDAVTLSRAFPCVHHAQVDLRLISPLFDDHPDSWRFLESLTFHTLHSNDWLPTDRLVSWLKRRQKLGLPRLRLKFLTAAIDNSWKVAHENDAGLFSKLYEELRMHCILDVEDFLLKPDMYLSMEGDSPLRVVSVKFVN